MRDWQLRISFAATIIVVLLGLWTHETRIREQQQQIEQTTQAVFSLAQMQGAVEQSGFAMGKEYCFFFADYGHGKVLLGEFDQEISNGKQPRLIIMGGIEEKLLDNWSKQPLLYNKYRKIP